MEPIKVVVYGASGRMGQEVVKAVCQDPETQLAGAVEVQVSEDFLTLPDGSGKVPFSAKLDSILGISYCPLLFSWRRAGTHRRGRSLPL